MKDNGGPAFPVIHTIVTQPGSFTQAPLGHEGMTLRDWFAGMAMHGYLAGRNSGPGCYLAEYVARDCYGYADAMLAARKETP
jgi:hypothetical protein